MFLVRGLVVEDLGRAPIPSGYADPASRPEVVPEQPADLTRGPSNLVLLHLTPSHSEPHGRGDHAVPINQCSKIESWCLQAQPSEPDPEQTSAFGNTVEPREWPGWARCGPGEIGPGFTRGPMTAGSNRPSRVATAISRSFFFVTAASPPKAFTWSW